MSGGNLDYFYSRFDEPLEKISKEIKWGKNKKYLKIAQVYSHDVEWLLSGDYSDDSFLESIKEELEELEKNPDIIEPQLKKCPLCKYFSGKKCTNHWQMEYMDKESFEKRIADASDCYDFEEIDNEV